MVRSWVEYGAGRATDWPGGRFSENASDSSRASYMQQRLDGSLTDVERNVASPEHIESLLGRVAARDSRALGELYDCTARYVLGLVRRIVADSDAAAEITQEVYVQVWRTAASFDPVRASGWSWLALLARSRAVDRLRAERSYRGALANFELEPAGAVPSPEDEAGLAERRRLVRSAMAELPPEQRESLELAFFDGLSHSEIANRIDMSLGTVKTRIRAAIQKLERALGPVLR
jgi:RNA polymerase sigma-70 factor, ECF subfamily